jgi:aerobic-type carbon monoxide dehydrogenase small subunit (CoxS/CutS family)
VSGEVAFGFQLNGTHVELSVPAETCLVDVLRDRFFLTGTKVSCDQGVCGACTVLIDGRPAAACSTFAFDVDGRTVTTIEGISAGTALHPVQRAFVEASAIQCGFCTPGMVLSCIALLQGNPDPSTAETAAWLRANVCRCTGYQMIGEAVAAAARSGP